MGILPELTCTRWGVWPLHQHQHRERPSFFYHLQPAVSAAMTQEGALSEAYSLALPFPKSTRLASNADVA